MNDMDKNGDEMKPGDRIKGSGISGGGIECERVLDLAPTYADGELPSDLADSVRSHLMDCSPCRLAVQDHVSLGAWFVPTEEVPVPAGFASRVAELAFSELACRELAPNGAGSGSSVGAEVQPERAPAPVEHQLTLTPRGPQRAVAASGSSFDSSSVDEEGRGRLLSFSVALTAAAAAAALLLTLFLASREEPGVGEDPIYADKDIALNLEALDLENRALTEPVQDPVTQPEDGK